MKIIQITDAHLFNDPSKTKDNINHHDTFHQCIDLAKKQKPDLVLATGDFVNDIDSAAYDYVVKGFEELNCPCHWVLGNHDEDPVLAKKCLALGRNLSNQKQIITNNNWQIILLDSQWNNEFAGYLDKQEIEFLTRCLEQCKLPTLIALHHNPVDMNNIAYEPINLSNAHEFFEAIKPYEKTQQIKLCLFGHVHHAYKKTQQGINFYGCPSTCRQNVPNITGFMRDKISAGIREVVLSTNGSYTTQVLRTGK